jgi:putative transposase
MSEPGLQVGKTRYTHYSIAYHLVWLPKYRRRILTGDVQKETKRLIAQCCERQGLTLLALETDEEHIHVVVSAPPRFSPALIANLLKGYSSRYLQEQYPPPQKGVRQGASVVQQLLCRHGGQRVSGSHYALPSRVSGEIAGLVRVPPRLPTLPKRNGAIIPPDEWSWDFPRRFVNWTQTPSRRAGASALSRVRYAAVSPQTRSGAASYTRLAAHGRRR